ncbi:protein-disulfide reductase DsbD family protein [Sphingomonas sp.]|uniref:protein-disulfide reductase DsbD family protein n=1 Tax=Sphingomonas sp. TaxID=28214 RepID=UPI003B00483D
MTALRFLFVTLLALLAGTAAAQGPGAAPHILAQIVPESDAPRPGARTTLAIAMSPQPGWHGYWQQPGDSGLPPQLAWTLPPALRVGVPAYPVPGMLVIAGLMNHVYEKPFALLVPLDVAAGTPAGTRLPVRLRLDYLVCTTSLCVPEHAELATELIVGGGAVDPATAARFEGWRAALPRPLGATARFEAKGGRVRIALPWPAGASLAAPHLFVATDGAVEPGATQAFARDGDRLVIDTAAGPARARAIDAVLATGGDGLSFRATTGAVPPARPAAGMLAATLIALLGAVAGGLVLNVMPCVFPILSLKALSLARAGGGERGARVEALAYAGGVIAVCVALGGAILALRAGGSAAGWAFQLQDARVVAALLLLAAAIGFNLAGLFELPGIGAGGGLAGRGGAAGAFWTGALAAFVATPCTGPFMAAALGAALLLPWPAALTVFAGLGLGLALPFLAIGFVPALRRLLPRPGAWMETFRRLLAVPMWLTALGLAWVLGRQAGDEAVVAAVGAATALAIGLWLTGLRQRAFGRAAWAPAALGLAAAAAIVAMAPTASAAPTQSAGSERFDPTRLAALRRSGRPVFLYFTADWCLSCKVNERLAIDRVETRAAFARGHVATMVGDWTRGDPAIGHFLSEHGRSGVPLYLWYGADGQARELPQVLTPGLLAGLASGR